MASSLLARADETTQTGSKDAPSKDVIRFDAILQRMTAYMDSLATYEVQVVQDWELHGDHARKGVNEFVLAAKHSGAFHLSLASQPSSESTLQCAGDGQSIICLLGYDGKSCYSERAGSLKQILREPYLSSNLRFSGLDLLLQTDPASNILSLASHIKYNGEENVGDVKADHFSFKWAVEATTIDLWIAAGAQPLLLKTEFKHQSNAGEGLEHTIDSHSLLKWTPNQPLTEQRLALALPTDAAKTSDIYSFLLDGSSQTLLGKPHPNVDLKTLDGKPWSPEDCDGDTVVAMVFWSSRAAPSLPDTEEIRKFMQQFEAKGVGFYLVNVGETRENVQEFVASRGISHQVILDPDRVAAGAYGVTSLPTTIALGSDGSVQSAHVGSSPDVVTLIAQDLEKLVAGEVLATSGQ